MSYQSIQPATGNPLLPLGAHTDPATYSVPAG
jgi:hypothetical protein